jgi:hypothetical protein
MNNKNPPTRRFASAPRDRSKNLGARFRRENRRTTALDPERAFRANIRDVVAPRPAFGRKVLGMRAP